MRMHPAFFPWILTVCLCLAPLIGLGQTPEAEQTTATGKMMGYVRWAAEVPQVQILPVDRDLSICGANGEVPFEPIVTGPQRGIVGAFVLVSPVSRLSTEITGTVPGKLHVELKECTIEPRAGVLRLKGTIDLFAADQTALDLKMTSPSGKEIDVPLSGMLSRQSRALDEVGLWTIRTPGRPWVWAQVLVTQAESMVKTDLKGEWSLQNIVPGRFQVEVWHPSITMTPRKRMGVVRGYELGEPLKARRNVRITAGRTEFVRIPLGQ